MLSWLKKKKKKNNRKKKHRDFALRGFANTTRVFPIGEKEKKNLINKFYVPTACEKIIKRWIPMMRHSWDSYLLPKFRFLFLEITDLSDSCVKNYSKVSNMVEDMYQRDTSK